MNLIDGNVNPLTIQWSPTNIAADAMDTYTLSYQVGGSSDWSTLATLTRDSNGNLPTSIGLNVSDQTQYSFKVQATTWAGATSSANDPQSSVSVVTTLSQVTSDNPSHSFDLTDPTATIPCLPPTNPSNPNYLNILNLLLLNESICGAQEDQVAWQACAAPLSKLFCPSIPQTLIPRPGYAIFAPTSVTCQLLGANGGTITLAGTHYGVAERGQRAGSAILNHPKVQALGIGSPLFAALQAGVQQALNEMNGFISSGRYRQAEGIVAELWGEYAIIDDIAVSSSVDQIGLYDIEQLVAPSTGRADALMRLYQDVDGGTIVKVVWDSKQWSQSYLTLVQNDPQRFAELVSQLQRYQLDSANRVVVQFGTTGADAITGLNPLWVELSDPQYALDMSRLSLRLIQLWVTPSARVFQSGVH